jgi:hypothetical protein
MASDSHRRKLQLRFRALEKRGKFCGAVVETYTGEPMARYLSQHTLACLTRQGAEELGRRLLAAKAVTARRVLVNMQEGKMVVEFEAGSREELEKWLAGEKFHFDWLLRVEFEFEGGSLRPLA